MRREGQVERPTHGFHTWPASLHPDAARDLVAAFPGDSVLDPFCGGGTILIEAMRAGRRAVGRDLSSVAVLVATARTAAFDPAAAADLRATSRRIAEAARTAEVLPSDPVYSVVESWYEEHVLCELEALRAGVEAHQGPGSALLWAAFSSILVKASHRVSDTSPRREPKHRPKGTTAILFHKKARELGRGLDALRLALPPGTPASEVARADARNRTANKVDLVLTSPPYPSTYDYLPMQHLRHVWLDIHDSGEALEIGSRRAWRDGGQDARRAWVDDTREWTSSAAAALSPGGHLVVVVGDGLTPTGMIDTSEPTERAAVAAGLSAVARVSLARSDVARQTERWEHCFVFRRAKTV